MSWSIDKAGPGEYLIMDEKSVLRGSIVALLRFRVEILWWGPGGDMTAEFKEYAQAVAFVQGVEIASDRWQRVIARQITEASP